MDQQIQNGQSPEFLRHLLKNPATASAGKQQLEVLVQNHPQCSVFRMLLAKATQNIDGAAASQNLHLAAVHAANREVLFRLIHQPEQLTASSENRIYQKHQPQNAIKTAEPDTSFIEEKSADIGENSSAETEKPQVSDTSFTEKKPVNIDEVSAAENENQEVSDAPFTEEKSINIDEISEVENEKTEISDTSFTEEKSINIDEISEVENKRPEVENTSFIDEKSGDIEEIPSEETDIPEVENTSFIEEKAVNIEETPSAETEKTKISDASFIEEKPVNIDNVPSVETEKTEISDTSFIDEKSGDIEEIPSAETEKPEVENTSFIEEKSVNIEKIPSAENDKTEIENTSFTEKKPSEETIAAENDLRAEDVNRSFVNEPEAEIIFPETETLQQQQAAVNLNAAIIDDYFSVIDEEVYDEITAIEDIKFEVIKTAPPEKTEAVTEPIPEFVTEPVPEPEKTEKPTFGAEDKAEKEMLGRIASIDYFTFNNRFGSKKEEVAEPVTEQKPAATAVKNEDLSPEKEPEMVSKYHDDKMPYTFMWWLDKTRKEYAGTYQPYVKLPQIQQNEQKLSVGPELHQQYIESIFHAKQPIGLEEINLPPVTEPPVKRKEDVLIERFIIEEPHIHPPSADRLDTENKAKKSSEDGDILVTETLAKIYFDQMLYHKALDTYKKLVLKFPEKSRYFTSQIELIEKKIN